MRLSAVGSVGFGTVRETAEALSKEDEEKEKDEWRKGGGGYTPSIKRQSVRPSVKPGDFAMYKRQIKCQEVIT